MLELRFLPAADMYIRVMLNQQPKLSWLFEIDRSE
jgi:hypothetical protein